MSEEHIVTGNIKVFTFSCVRIVEYESESDIDLESIFVFRIDVHQQIIEIFVSITCINFPVNGFVMSFLFRVIINNICVSIY